MQTTCKVCGNPVTLELPPIDALDSEMGGVIEHMLRSIAPSVVHDGCFDREKEKRFRANEARLLQKRNEDWETLCPPLYLDTDPERLNQTNLAKALGWKYGPQGFAFMGPTGAGKTRTMWLLLREQYRAGKFIAALTHTEFSAKATLASWQSNPSAISWIKLLTNADILFIDDLGKARFQTADGSSKAAEEVLFSILEKRWSNKRPCMFTTNGTSQQFETQMSKECAAPFVRRLKEFQTAIHF